MAEVEVEHGGVERENGLGAHPGLVRTGSFRDTILLILAICFHSVFEGIAVGAAGRRHGNILPKYQNCLHLKLISATAVDAWRNLWTISLHKIFAAVAMGIALLRMLPKRPLVTTIAYSLAFAISSPIRIGIGIAIDDTTQGNTADWIFSSMGLACGIFIYVANNHLISKGFRPQEPSYFNTPFFKFLALLAGVGLIAVVGGLALATLADSTLGCKKMLSSPAWAWSWLGYVRLRCELLHKRLNVEADTGEDGRASMQANNGDGALAARIVQ
ncbi:hypothetical protein Taro_056558, partial [Colocasia esculenta]|nr:hypothetical protein [Colocasia esculenta]